MKTIRVQFRHYWPGFDLPHFQRMFAFLAPYFRFEESAAPEVIFFSTFDGSKVLRKPPVVEASALRVFHTGENVTPDLSTTEFALSFRRDLDSPRHLRFPSFLCRMGMFGYTLEDLLRGGDDRRAILAEKTKFCAFMHRKDVTLRNQFVQKLSRYRPVECAGRCLRNVDLQVPAEQKVAYLRPFKFVMAFENEASPGYVTEKLVDAMLARGVGLYYGAPDVGQDFHKGAFLDLADFPDEEAMIERIIELDQDADQYQALQAEPYFAGDRVPPHLQLERAIEFFHRVLRDCGRPVFPVATPWTGRRVPLRAVEPGDPISVTPSS